MAVALALLSACTVRPLYSSAPSDGSMSVTTDLASIAIKPVGSRYAQEVRNHLIFLFNGGAGQPAVAAYTLALTVSVIHERGAVIQIASENEPTAGTATLTARYVLSDTASGKELATGSRRITAAYDVSRQEFSADRARRDAENRAAREVAELLRLAIAQNLAAPR